jgi:hypothetical protein
LKIFVDKHTFYKLKSIVYNIILIYSAEAQTPKSFDAMKMTNYLLY